MREEALVKSELECTVIGMTHDFFLGKVSLVMRNKEIRLGTAVVGESLPVMRKLGKIQVLLGWIGHEQRMEPDAAVITIDRSLSVCTK